jgi:hypothetical protein
MRRHQPSHRYEAPQLSAPHKATAASAAARLTQDAQPGAAAWAVADNADPQAPSQLSLMEPSA